MNHYAFRRVSKENKDIIVEMLKKSPEFRIKPEKVLHHPFFVKKYQFSQPLSPNEHLNELTRHYQKLINQRMKEVTE